MSLSLSPSITTAPASSAGILDVSSGVTGVVAQLDPTRLAPSVTEELAELTVSPRMEAIKKLVLTDAREMQSLTEAMLDDSPVFVTQFDELARPMTAEAFIANSLYEGKVLAIEEEMAAARSREGSPLAVAA